MHHGILIIIKTIVSQRGLIYFKCRQISGIIPDPLLALSWPKPQILNWVLKLNFQSMSILTPVTLVENQLRKIFNVKVQWLRFTGLFQALGNSLYEFQGLAKKRLQHRFVWTSHEGLTLSFWTPSFQIWLAHLELDFLHAFTNILFKKVLALRLS